MKVAINAGYGGFHLSPEAVEYIAKKQGKECFFFKTTYKDREIGQEACTKEECSGALIWSAYTRADALEYLGKQNLHNWNDFTGEEREERNRRYEEIRLDSTPRHDKRTDPLLIEAIEVLGSQASGKCATLKVVEVPDDVKWEIEEYDGWESVEEVHRSWS